MARIRTVLARTTVALLCSLSVLAVRVSMSAKSPAAPASNQGQGKQLFVSRCGGCHGIDGRGGEHAPDIATSPIVQAFSEARLESIIENGIPSHGMPGFSSLGPDQVKAVADYLFFLQGKGSSVDVRGNPSRGRQLFFGRAQCSNCHLIQGQGGFLGADLTLYARTHSPKEIKEAIISPGKYLLPGMNAVVAVTRDGQKFTGIARNEDNFSLQLQTADGAFHLLMKSDLETWQRLPKPLMPADYATRLSAHEVDDLISFLVEASRNGGSR